jgi:hypothetical protein
VTFGVRVSEAWLLDALERFLPPGHLRAPSPRVAHVYSLVAGGEGPRPGVRRFHVVYSGGTRIARTRDLPEALAAFEGSVRLFVAMRAKARTYVHAGCVDLGGAVVLLPGSTGTGKSTLVAALLQAGAGYFSDEYAVLDAAARVHPYAKDLTLRACDGAPGRRLTVPELDVPVATASAPAGVVLLTRYRPGARFRPERLPGGLAVLALLAHAVPARIRPRGTFACLTRLVSRVPVYRGDRSDVSPVIEWLRSRHAPA